MGNDLSVFVQPALQAQKEEDKAKMVAVGWLFDSFGQQPTKDQMKEYRDALRDCSPDAVRAACEKYAVSDAEFRPRPLKIRAAALEFERGRRLRLVAWKARAREELDERFRSAVLQAERRKESAIAEARSMCLPYCVFAKLMDESILACCVDIQRLEQARAMEFERIDALKSLPEGKMEAKALEG